MAEDRNRGEHRWKFIRVGGVDQVVIKDGNDIAHIPELDQKLWIALAMPARIPGFPTETLTFLDSDRDGRIRAPEIIQAIQFLKANLSDLSILTKPGEELPLSLISDQELSGSASWMLGLAGKPAATAITPEDAALASGLFGAQRFNGDGVMIQSSAGSDSGTADFITRILASFPGAMDASGMAGVDKATLDAFLASSAATAAWMKSWENIPDIDSFRKSLGSGTDFSTALSAARTAASAFATVKPKIDDWFLRSSIADPVLVQAGTILDFAREEDRQRFRSSPIEPTDPAIQALPIAIPNREGILDLNGSLNPAWAASARQFRDSFLIPVSGIFIGTLDRKTWEKLSAFASGLAAWLNAAPSTIIPVTNASEAESLASSPLALSLVSLMNEDASWVKARSHITVLRNLLLLRRDFYRILGNFVCFSEFYTKKAAVFQCGTLYMDGRACTLCMEVEDPGKHGTLAAMSATYLAYCQASRPDGAKKSIVAAFTAGDGDNLFPGRNGIFYDKDGKDWDATITKVVAQPISIKEAFWSPYKWLGRTIEDLIAKRAQNAEAANQTKLKSGADAAVAQVADGKKTEPAAPKKFEVGTIAAIGVALGSLGAMVTGILATFLGLGLWMPAGILGALLMVSGPSMLLAWFKLRRRNLGPLLDASGWAINSRVKINVPFGRSLTYAAALPLNAERSMVDPYAEKKRPWKLYMVLALVLVLIIVWLTGTVDGILPEAVTFGSLFGGR